MDAAPRSDRARVLLTGVPGVGKTSITMGIARLIPAVEVCEFGKLMTHIGIESGMIYPIWRLELVFIFKTQLLHASVVLTKRLQ